MCVGKGGIQCTDQFRVRVNDLENVGGREGLSSQTALDLQQNFCVRAVIRIQSGHQRGIVGTCISISEDSLRKVL